MFKLGFVVTACLAICSADVHVPQRGMIHQIPEGVAGPNPYIFLTAPKGRSQSLIHGFEVIEENDENEKSSTNEDYEDVKELNYDEENSGEDFNYNNKDGDDDDDGDDGKKFYDQQESEENMMGEEVNDVDDNDDYDNDNDIISNAQLENIKASQMMLSRQHNGVIMVPDEILEIEGQQVIDRNTGQITLLLPRAILNSIPDGSIVALIERPSDDEAEARANRVIVRRRRKGARRNIKRRPVNKKRYRIVKRTGNKRRNNYRPKNKRVVLRGNGQSGNKQQLNRRHIYVQI